MLQDPPAEELVHLFRALCQDQVFMLWSLPHHPENALAHRERNAFVEEIRRGSYEDLARFLPTERQVKYRFIQANFPGPVWPPVLNLRESREMRACLSVSRA